MLMIYPRLETGEGLFSGDLGKINLRGGVWLAQGGESSS